MTIKFGRRTLFYTAQQAYFLGIYIFLGIALFALTYFNVFDRNVINRMIFFYGFLSPMIVLWLYFNDLRSSTYYYSLLFVSFIQIIISLNTIKNPYFELNSASLTYQSFIVLSSTETLKSLFIFLVGFQLLRWINFKIEGREMAKTIFLSGFYSHVDQRKISVMDIALNLALFFLIVLSNMIPFRYLLL